jgi:5'-nucleotidase
MSKAPSVSRARVALLLATLVALLAVSAASPTAEAKGGADKERPVEVGVLAINDFHGNLQPPAGSSGRITTSFTSPATTVDAGGVEYLGTHIDQLRSKYRNSVVVSAGDLIGATPLLSALFHDEPTIEAMNTLGLDINAVGNHEFDKGYLELLRLAGGGCHPADGCTGSNPYRGADFQFLAANVTIEATGKTVFPTYDVRTFDGVRVAFIGMTLEGTPSIVTPAGVAGLRFDDEADTVNALVPELRKRNIEAIVVLVHEGGFPAGNNLINQCNGISGPIVDIVERLHPAVDAVITGHTHQAYNCEIDGRLVTSASSFGRLVTDIKLTLDRKTKDVIAVEAENKIVTRDVAQHEALSALVARYDAISAPLRNRVIGSITADITRATNAAGESALGDVIADAQLAATRPSELGGALVAFMNPGGIRTDLIYNQSSGGELPGEVTYGESFAVQPFGNNLVTMTLTGVQIDTLLEQQFNNPGPGQNRILQVSGGFTYTWSPSAPAGSKVDIASIEIDGTPIDPTASYRVTVNSFLADGGDGFSVLPGGVNRIGGVVDTQALEDYFKANSPVAPGPQNRIAQLP